MCGRSAETRMSSTRMLPGGCWTFHHLAQNRSSEKNSIQLLPIPLPHENAISELVPIYTIMRELREIA